MPASETGSCCIPQTSLIITRLRAPGRPSLPSGSGGKPTFNAFVVSRIVSIRHTNRPKNFRGSVQYCDIARPPKATITAVTYNKAFARKADLGPFANKNRVPAIETVW
ncbi:hypothetical protein V8E54_001179 [Elaphomyces granulatus]